MTQVVSGHYYPCPFCKSDNIEVISMSYDLIEMDTKDKVHTRVCQDCCRCWKPARDKSDFEPPYIHS